MRFFEGLTMKIDRDLFIDQGYLVFRNVIPKKTVLFLLGLMILVGLACGDSTEKVNDYLSKAKLHLDNGEYQKAIEDLTAVIRLNTQDELAALAYSNRATVYTKLNQYQKAIEDLTEAIRIDPKFAKAYYNRAYIYNELGEYQKSIEDYTEVIDKASPLDPIIGLVYASRGLAYGELGQKDKADSDRQRACELDSKFCE